LINFKGDLFTVVKNPLTKPLLIYFIITIPSFINTPAPLLSLRDYSNLISLIIVFYVTIIGFSTDIEMRNAFYIFICALFLHSIFVDYLGLMSSHRAFGLLGVYYIDFAGLGGVISFIAVIYTKGIKRILMCVILVVITLGLILTQTRNAWFAFGFAIITLLFFLIIKGKLFYIKRSSVITLLLISISFVFIMVLFTGNVGASIEKRFDLKSQTVDADENADISQNSFASRALIWHTAAMAYIEHPIIGIGAYSFKHISIMYYKIPKKLFQEFVQGRTPHVTYLQVLTETGIIGLLGFIIFIISIVRFIIKSLKCPHTENDVVRSLMIIWSLIYILFSMFMTESWLYGQYTMWFGVLLGFLINNHKLLNLNPVKN